MSEPTVATLRRAFDDLMSSAPPRGDVPEYVLGLPVGAGYAGVSRTGSASLLIPLPARPGGVARAAGGCLLRPAADVEFSFAGRKWNQPAAILECTDPSVLDPFTVLALDVALRTSAQGQTSQWADVAHLVDEWYTLLGRRHDLSQEDEIGLWGEVWFLSQASDPDRLASAWVGPEGGPSDFVLGGACVEVKTSRSRLKHFVSQTQVDRPMGELKAYFVSLWVGLDPESGTTLPILADLLLARLRDPASVLKRLLQSGYSPSDRHAYQKAFVLLDQPCWFSAGDIPRVRMADPGVSNLRYVVMIEQSRALASEDVDQLRERFYGTASTSVPIPQI